jgi:FkbM family methyltransferase
MTLAWKDSSWAWQIRRSRIWRHFRETPLKVAEVEFYRKLISSLPAGRIVDIGANRGSKSEIFYRFADGVVAIEPDRDAVRTLKARFRRKPVIVLELAIAERTEQIPFYRFGPGSAFNTASSDWAASMTDGTNHMQLKLSEPQATYVQGETLANIVSKYRPVKYVKIDAEGLEEKIVSTLGEAVPLISMEFNLPQMWDSLQQCVKHLEGLNKQYRFNVSTTEPPDHLEWEEWLTAHEVVLRIQSRGWQFVEIYARNI